MSLELEEKHAVIIGSGFGGAVFACRLGQAFGGRDFDVCLLERGRRYAPGDFPRVRWPDYLSEDPLHRTSRRVPDAARLLWGVDQGLLDLRSLGALQCVGAAGYGGGSLIYANVHLQPPSSAFESWPDEYKGDHRLEAEFDLAAEYMDARPLPPGLRERIPKAKAMRVAAERLGRKLGAGNDTDFFYPPLAIHFGAAGPNRFGKEQGSCNSCGNCIAGCPERAKNTLDFNYLACAERCGVEVRTLSEVLHLEQSGERYVVVYFDHIEGRPRRIRAPYVFLAAGAVGSTELLLRSRPHLKPREAGAVNGLEHLGERFFANGDSLGVVFDCADAAQAGEGPTITTALLHAEPLQPEHEARGQAPPLQERPANGASATPRSEPPVTEPRLTWFLIQDGGIPTSYERLLGAFRSPLLLGRNRLTQAARGAASGGASPARSTPAAPLVELALAAASVARHFGAAADEPAPAQQFPSAWVELLPRPLRSMATTVATASDTARARMLELDARVLEKMAPATLFLSRLVKPEQVLEQVADATGELYPLLRHLFRKQRGFELAISLLTHLLITRATPEKTLVLLAMGPDQQGRLQLERGKLKVSWQEGANLALFGLQERLMRDLAVQLGGELRSNPAFTLSRKAVSVHAQGGCGMGKAGESVTGADGQVHGLPNLYVVDAAAFPASVGVNPSATILAVAERKAKWFVRAHRARRAYPRAGSRRRLPIVTPPPVRGLPTTERTRSTALRVVPTAPVQSRPIGLWWKERMEGSFSALACPPLGGALDVTGFEASERRGREHGARLMAELSVMIDDVDLFLRSFRAHVGKQKVEARVWGKVTVEFSRGAARRTRTYRVRPGHGVLEFLQGDAQAPNAEAGIDPVPAAAPKGTRERARDLLGLRYALTLDPEDAAGGGALVLHGRKVFQDDPGHDVWPDVTTLFFTLHGSSAARARSGIVRVGLRDFLEVQLPSMDTFMEGEPRRDPRADGGAADWQSLYKPAESARLWALLRFFGAMSWGIKDVYARWF